ncbi:MAG: CRTAC1 family protein [Saprospiraceae bacterium]|nr:CRTAC1 family protein [Saprospiraceae bacterium]
MKTTQFLYRNSLPLLLTLISYTSWAQAHFTKVEQGTVVEKPSDSRSVNFVDVNNDGWEDLFISNGPSSGQHNFLYINQGDGTFTSLTDDPIVQDGAKSDGATFADVDNDGDLDAYVVTWYGQQNYFYRNQGDGSFLLDKDPVLTTKGTYSETASWGDVNNDGWLDLFLTNSEGKNKQNQLFLNQNGNHFQSTETPANQTKTLSRSVNWIDINKDGKSDLFITNEGKSPNELYLNSGKAPFFLPEQQEIWGELPTGSMSASWGDVDNDGDLDLFLANAGYYQEINNQLLLNDGKGNFTQKRGSTLSQDGGCSYGSAFGDFDNDGDLDLIVANGFCKSKLENWLYQNDGKGNFTRLPTALPNMASHCSFGLAWGDINNDGFLDLAIANCQNGKNQAQPVNDLYLNNGNTNHWLKIKLEGTASNRSAIGATVRVLTKGGKWQMRHINTQSGYCGQNSLIAHFGLGSSKKVRKIEIIWPSGKRTSMRNQKANQQLDLVEE